MVYTNTNRSEEQPMTGEKNSASITIIPPEPQGIKSGSGAPPGYSAVYLPGCPMPLYVAGTVLVHEFVAPK